MTGGASVRQSGSYSKIDARAGAQSGKQGAKLTAAIHDLRNLLFVISTCSEAALDDADPGSDLFESLSDIATAAVRATHVVEGLAHAEGGPAGASAVDVNLVVREFLPILRRQGGSRARVTFDSGPRELRACIDQHALEHALLNLVVNAVDAIEDVGSVIIRSEGAANVVRITVSDTGTGMDETTLARAFEPRFTTRAGMGRSGLGLSTVRDLIEGVGGKVWAVSRLGAGSEVVLELPGELS